MISQWMLMGALTLVGLYLLKAKRSRQPPGNSPPLHRDRTDCRVCGRLIPGIHELCSCSPGYWSGADLLLYGFVIFALFYSVYQYRRQLWQEKVTTDLARSLTLTQASLEDALTKLGSGPR